MWGGVRWQDQAGLAGARASAPWGCALARLWGRRVEERTSEGGPAGWGWGGVGGPAPRAPLTSAHLRSAGLPAPAPRVAAGKFPKPGRREAPRPLPPSATRASGGGLAWSRGAAAAAAAEGNSKSRLRRRLLPSRRRLLRPLPRRGTVAGGAQGGSGEGPRPARRLPPPSPPPSACLPPASLCLLLQPRPLSGYPLQPPATTSVGRRSGVGSPDLCWAWAGGGLHQRLSAGTLASRWRSSEGAHEDRAWPPGPPPAATGERA